MGELTVRSTAHSYPRLPYEKMKDDILGSRYRLSLVFVGATRAKQLNQSYRKKEYVPNVLSFPLDSENGEIFIAPVVAKKQAPRYNLSEKGYIGYLFIHALLHLKGHKHGDTMEEMETSYLQKYSLR